MWLRENRFAVGCSRVLPVSILVWVVIIVLILRGCGVV